MKNNLFALLLAIGAAMPSFANEVFVDIKFKENDEIYRVTTDDEQSCPIGLFYCPDSRLKGYLIDKLGNHRFIKKNETAEEAYVASSNQIYRQIFDGPASESDKGRAGNATCYDSRDKLVSGENGKIVYRTPSVAFSSGTGKQVSEKEAKRNLIDGECESVEGKSWYMIPNGSWYQTWNKASGSYDIFFDRWEEKQARYYEDLYRGEPINRAFSDKIAAVPTRKLMRAKVDGALEEVEGGELKPVLSADYKHQFFLMPELRRRANEMCCYYWSGKGKGSFIVGEKPVEIEPMVETSDPDNRFVCCGTSITALGKYYVLGTDVLRNWLKKSGMSDSSAECTNVVSIALQKTLKTMIFVYSKPENCVYRFIIDESKSYDVGLPKKYAVDFNIAAMAITSEGNLYVVPEVASKPMPTLTNLDGIEMETNKILESDNQPTSSSNSSDAETQESFEVRTKMMNLLTTNAECMLILSRAYYQDFYELPFGADAFKKLDYSIFLGKEFFSAKASFKNISLATLDASLEILLETAKKTGNHIEEVIDNVPGYPNTFRKPESYLLTVDENY